MAQKWHAQTIITFGGKVLYRKDLSIAEIRSILLPRRRSPRRKQTKPTEKRPRRTYTKQSAYWTKKKEK